ncbi:superoxide dismutase [Mn], mitochondrial-like [Aethina tumida]|uniref:superoxide dismutase [Mn], mitochondrial-like n=1 Tax=Aethina tumida TaxID=116153 RepID=UPI002147BC85|nr:superoxide dismutase [Mn], mitochondrial-like [Aethina tumida]
MNQILQQAAKGTFNAVKHKLPELPYEYSALEPVISCEIMQLHHQKHHAAYVNNLNLNQQKLIKALECNDQTQIIQTFKAIQFNGGGHINHTIFWENLCPDQTQPSKELCEAIKKTYVDGEGMKKCLSAIAVGLQGSGWAWLGYNPKTKTLVCTSTANQDPLEATKGVKPLLGIDVWEHAYYLQYKNVKADYVKAIFDVVNWEDVSKRFAEASCS